jgi:uncharacterized phage-associated protein
MPLAAKFVAAALLQEAKQMGITDVSNMKLQKLLYDTQGYHLALFDARAFQEDLVAWQHGAVVESVYHEFKVFGDQAIQVPDRTVHVPEPVRAAIRLALSGRGTKTAFQLSKENHREDPWKEAWTITRWLRETFGSKKARPLKDATMKTLFCKMFTQRQIASPQTPAEGGLCLELAEWNSLEENLAAPPSEALKQFMKTQPMVSDELESVLEARYATT